MKKEIYQAPSMKVVEVQVEKGFVDSQAGTQGREFTTNINEGSSNRWLQQDNAAGEGMHEGTHIF